MSGDCILGVDFALCAIAFYFSTPRVVSAEDMPIADGNVDAATLAARIAQMRPDAAIIELAAPRRDQGVGSAFKFGFGFGMIRGVLAATGVPLHLVPAGKWKRAHGLDADTEKSRALALRLWPTRSDLFGCKRDHSRAEAALLARYAVERIVERGRL